MINHEKNMISVLSEAYKSIKLDESPFAAGIWSEGSLLICHNMSRSKKNPIMHAEIVCINKFCENNDIEKLRDAIMYTSCEPCLMCLHAIANAGIRKIYYAANIDDAILYESGDVCVHTIDYVKKMNLDIDITGGLQREKMCGIFEYCIEYRGEL